MNLARLLLHSNIKMVFTREHNQAQIEISVLQSVSKYGNIILVMGVGLVLAMMMLPLPSTLLDFLLASNVVATITILLVAIRVTSTMKIASFPTLLLIATLFRLGLNVASTRLILAHGFAGEIIQTFGAFVTGGNLLVGLILLFILTLIQFMVIAKGSERVAEVSARFSLDALPGKQMSIDADLRSGLITQEEARLSRDELHRESKLYGSMDGAMKFVKGDAIAGIVITCINIMGGLFAGLVQRGMTLNEALYTYSILTIGDGLVTQIPALLLAVTAGFVVTRVVDSESETSLGEEMGLQLLAQPRALLVASGLSLLIGLIPGLPFLCFFILSSGLAGLSFLVTSSIKKRISLPCPLDSYVVNLDEISSSSVTEVSPLALEIGPELYRVFKEDHRWTHFLGVLYPRLRTYLAEQLGIPFPDIRVTVSPHLAQSFSYAIRVFEIPVDGGILTPRYCSLPVEPKLSLKFTEDPPIKTTETLHGTPVALWNIGRKADLTARGLQVYGPEEMLLRHLNQILRRHAADFIGIQEVRDILNVIERGYPELVHEVVPKMISIQKLTDIVKRLVEEQVPIKDFRLILQILSTCQPETRDAVSLTEVVRLGLSRIITFIHLNHENTLVALTLDSALEDEIRSAIQKTGNESYLALPPERVQIIVDAFKVALEPSGSLPPVILTQLDVRRFVFKIIEGTSPSTSVLSFQELDPRVLINNVGTVSTTHVSLDTPSP